MHGKLKSVEEAVALIKDNSTVAFTGSGGGLLESDYVMAAIATRTAKPDIRGISP